MSENEKLRYLDWEKNSDDQNTFLSMFVTDMVDTLIRYENIDTHDYVQHYKLYREEDYGEDKNALFDQREFVHHLYHLGCLQLRRDHLAGRFETRILATLFGLKITKLSISTQGASKKNTADAVKTRRWHLHLDENYFHHYPSGENCLSNEAADIQRSYYCYVCEKGYYEILQKKRYKHQDELISSQSEV